MRLQPGKERGIENQAVLDDLRKTGAELAIRQRFQSIRVRQHQLRLIKRANHVFAARVIDGRLTAHRGIHLSKQGGWNLNKGNSPLIGGGCESRDVADHTAAESDQRGFTIAGMLQQGIEYLVEGIPILMGLAIGQYDRQHQDLLRLQAVDQYSPIWQP